MKTMRTKHRQATVLLTIGSHSLRPFLSLMHPREENPD